MKLYISVFIFLLNIEDLNDQSIRSQLQRFIIVGFFKQV